MHDHTRRDDLVQGLAERVGAQAGASAVFGEPVERAGVTVIPVARATWGFGGGRSGEAGESVGGGGGGLVSPLGYIEMRESGAQFKPIRDPRVVALAIGAGMGAAGLSARVARRLLRR